MDIFSLIAVIILTTLLVSGIMVIYLKKFVMDWVQKKLEEFNINFDQRKSIAYPKFLGITHRLLNIAKELVKDFNFNKNLIERLNQNIDELIENLLYYRSDFDEYSYYILYSYKDKLVYFSQLIEQFQESIKNKDRQKESEIKNELKTSYDDIDKLYKKIVNLLTLHEQSNHPIIDI